MERTVRCYAWGRPGDWQGICVDLDLAAQGESLEEVRRELGDAVEIFLSYVADLPENERGRFLNRKAPMALRLRLALWCWVATLGTALRLPARSQGLARLEFGMPTS